MNDDKKDGEAAFPLHPGLRDDRIEYMGLTKREWFAGQALAGRLATGNEDYLDAHDTAARCFAVADAMIAASKGAAQ